VTKLVSDYQLIDDNEEAYLFYEAILVILTDSSIYRDYWHLVMINESSDYRDPMISIVCPEMTLLMTLPLLRENLWSIQKQKPIEK